MLSFYHKFKNVFVVLVPFFVVVEPVFLILFHNFSMLILLIGIIHLIILLLIIFLGKPLEKIFIVLVNPLFKNLLKNELYRLNRNIKGDFILDFDVEKTYHCQLVKKGNDILIFCSKDLKKYELEFNLKENTLRISTNDAEMEEDFSFYYYIVKILNTQILESKK